MEVCFGPQWFSRSNWSTHSHSGVSLYVTVAPYMGFGSDELKTNVSRICDDHTDFVMHGSQQNNCDHVRVTGVCYQLNTGSFYNRPVDELPVFIFNDGADTVEGNYMFSFMTSVTPFVSKVNGSTKCTVVTTDIWEPVNYPGLSNCYAIYSWSQAVFEDLDTGYKYYNAWGRYHKEMLALTICYFDGKHISTNFIGRQYGYAEWGFDESDEPYIRWSPLSVDLRSKPVIKQFRTHSYLVTKPEVLRLMDLDPSQLFYLDFDWDAAMVPALNQVNFFDSNGIAFAKDIAHLPMVIKSDLDKLKSLSKVTASGKLKVAASIFLSVHYGYKLLAADGIELANELLKYQTECTNHLAQSVSAKIGLSERGSFKLSDANGHLNVYYNPYSRLCTDIGRFAEAVDLVPDFSNVWDMIPFSFVVDWFTNIGDLASGIDSFFTLTQQCDVLGSIISRTVSYTHRPDGFFGNLEFRSYRRTCREGWYPIPRFSFQLKNPVTNLYHWLESSALVVSKVM